MLCNLFILEPVLQHRVIPANLEASDEILEREAGTDITKM